MVVNISTEFLLTEKSYDMLTVCCALVLCSIDSEWFRALLLSLAKVPTVEVLKDESGLGALKESTSAVTVYVITMKKILSRMKQVL